MPIKYSNAVQQIEKSTSVSDVLYTLQTFFSGVEYCLQKVSVLSPFVEKLRKAPNSAMALNSFAHMLERMDASVYDAFMRQPENKDVIDLFKNTDRGTDEFRTKLFCEAIAKGKVLIDDFEKKEGISLEDNAKESLRVYNIAKDLAYNECSYADEELKSGTSNGWSEGHHYANTVLRKFEKDYYLPVWRKNTKILQKFHQFLIDKSSVTNEQAEKWFNQHVNIDSKYIRMALQEGWTKEILKDYIKGLYRIINGLSFDNIDISVKELDGNTAASTYKEDKKITIDTNNRKFSACVVTHEFGHVVDLCASGNYIAIHQFLKTRANGKIGTLGGFNKKGYQDKFYTKYAGTVYPVNATECFSTGLEQIGLVYNDSEIFYKYGYKYQAFDPEHLALILGLLQEAKDIDGSSRHKEIVAANTALAKSWMEAVKDSLQETTYDQMLTGIFSCDKFSLKTSQRRKKVYIKFSNSEDTIWLKEIVQDKIPVTVYTICGYYYQKFPFSLFGDIQKLPSLMDLANKNTVYIPFWYTIGMKLPKMG